MNLGKVMKQKFALAFVVLCGLCAITPNAMAQSKGNSLMEFANRWLFTSCPDAERIDTAAKVFSQSSSNAANIHVLEEYFWYRFQAGMFAADSIRMLANEERFYHLQPGNGADGQSSHPSTLATVALANENYRIRALAGLASCRTPFAKHVIDSLGTSPGEFAEAAKRFH